MEQICDCSHYICEFNFLFKRKMETSYVILKKIIIKKIILPKEKIKFFYCQLKSPWGKDFHKKSLKNKDKN